MGMLKNDYSLSVNVNVDTSKAQKDLDRFKKANSEGKNPLILQPDLNTAKIAEKLEKLGNLQGFQKINTKVSKIFQINDKPFIKATETFKNALGEIQERVVLFKQTSTGNFQEVQRQTIQLANGVKNVTESFSTSERTVGKYEATVKTLTKTITDTAGNTQQVITKTTEWVGSGNKLNTVIETLDANGNKLSATMHKISENTQKSESELKAEAEAMQLVYKSTEQTNETITRQGRSFKALITTTTEVKANGEKLTTTITKYRDALGRAVTETDKFDANQKRLGQTLREVDATAKNSSKGILGLGSSFIDCVGKVAKFYIATMPIMAVQTAITSAKEAVFDFDFALTEFNKVTELSSNEIEGYTQKLGELGAEVGRTRTEMIEASTEFRRGGFSSEESAELAKIATMFQNVSDAEISASDSASFLISQIKAFNIEASESEHIIDGVNEVAANFAVSTDDLVTALEKAGSALGTVGNDYNQTIALVTSAEEILQGQSSKVGLGLRTIAINLAKVASSAKGTEATIEGVTFAVKDQNGEMLNTYEIMQGLAPQWKNLSEEQKTLLAQTIAGKNRFDVFVSAMNNIDQATKSYETSLNSMGSAQRQNAVYMESLQAKVNALKAQFEELVLGGGGLHDLIATILDVGTAILKFANSDLGKFAIAIGSTIGVLSLLNKGFTLLKTNVTGFTLTKLIQEVIALKSGMQLATASQLSMTIATDGLAGAFDVLTASIMANPIGLIATAVVGATVGMIALADHIQKTEENIESIHEKATEFKEDIDNLENSINGLKDQLKQVEGKKLKTTDEHELELLEQEEQSLRNQLVIEEEKLRIKKEQASEDAKKALGKTVTFATDTGNGFSEAKEVTRQEGLTETIKYLDELQNRYNETEKAMKDMAESGRMLTEDGKEETKEYQEKEKELQKLKDTMLEQKETANNLASDLREEAEALDLTDENNKELYDSTMKSVNAWTEYTESANNATNAIGEAIEATEEYEEGAEETESDLEKMAKALKMSTKELIDNANAAGMSVEDYYEIRSAMNGIVDEMKNLQSGYGALNGIIEDYNDNNEISFENLESLLSLSPEYLSMLTMQNGKLVLNKDAIDAKAEALKLEAIEQAKTTAIEQLNTLTEQANATETKNNANVKINSAKDWEEYKNKIDDATDSLNKNTLAEQVNQAGKSAIDAGADVEKVNAIMNQFKNTVKLVESAQVSATKTQSRSTRSTGSHTKAVDKNTEALKKNVKALKLQKETLEKQKKKYDDVIGYIEKKIEGYIDELEKQKDTESKVFDDRIDKLEETKEKEINTIDATIKALEKEFKAYEDNYKKEKKIHEQKKVDLKEELKVLEDWYKGQKDAINDWYNNEIDKLDKTNEQLERQIKSEELLQNLNKAKSKTVRTYREGQGWVYEQDADAVSKAQKAIQEYNRELQQKDTKKALQEEKDAKLNALDASDSYYTTEKARLEGLIYKEDEYLETLENNYEKRKENYESETERLELKKEQVTKSIDDEIKALEKQQKAIEESYDKRIQKYQQYLDFFKEGIDAYENELNRQKALQLTGINFEKEGWQERLQNLDDFVTKYNKLQGDLKVATDKYDKANKKLQEAQSKSKSSGSSGSSSSGKDVKSSSNTKAKADTTKYTVFEILKSYDTKAKAEKAKQDMIKNKTFNSQTDGITKYGEKYVVYRKEKKDVVGKTSATTTTSTLSTQAQGKKKYGYKETSALATGTYGVRDDMIAIVGDNPNYQELAVGSRINSGTSMRLKSGTGIIPHNLTNTLVSMASAFNDGILNLKPNNTDNSTKVSIGNITLPNVKDGDDFVEYLQNFSSSMLQKSYSRV